MKFKFFVGGFLIALFLAGSAFSQEENHEIVLNDAIPNYVTPLVLKVTVGDSIQFKRISGEFAIFIEDALYYFGGTERHLEIKFDDENTEIGVRVNSTYDQEEAYLYYYVYCISGNNWPDAPPLIIIRNE